MVECEPTSSDTLLYGSRAAAPAPATQMERRPVPDDDDVATAETVRMMTDYIGAGVNDQVCRQWAAAAQNCYAFGQKSDPLSLIWGVFWLLKHSVRYRRDEPELFRIGQGDARDLLTAPAVLVREPQPAEDCDGFTMLACTLLRILGLSPFIVTIKADPKDPSRWSHVFAMVELPGRLVAVDGSHGKFPGGMVPREHIFGYQVWDMNGQRIRKQLPSSSRLSGYVRTGRGMGDVCPSLEQLMGISDSSDPCQTGAPISDLNVDPNATGVPGSVTQPGSVPPSSSFNLTSFLNNLIATAGKVATVAEAPPGATINPATGAITPGSLTSSLGSLMPWLIIGGVVVLIGSAIGGGGKRH